MSYEFESDEERKKELEKTEPFLFWRSCNQAKKDKLANATDRVIDLLRKELKLEPYECLLVVKTLYREFPLESLKTRKVKQ